MRLPPWMWRIIRSRRTKVALACSPFVLCAGIALAYPVTAWLGGLSVKRHIAALEAKGYPVKPEDYFVPCENPEGDVFRHPAMIREMEERKVERPSSLRRRMRVPQSQPALAEPMDVRAWFDPPEADEKTAAERMLGELRGMLERMEGLREALSRPHATWPVEWVSNEFTRGEKVLDTASPLFRMRNLSDFLVVETVFHLAAGDSASAFQSVEAMLDVQRHLLESQPSHISLLIAELAARHSATAIWEGVRRAGWTEPQLAAFEARMKSFDPQASALRSFSGAAVTECYMLEMAVKIHRIEDRRGVYPLRGWKWERERILARSHGIWRSIRPWGIGMMKQVKGSKITFRHGPSADGTPRTRFEPTDLLHFRQQMEKFPTALFIDDSTWTMRNQDHDAVGWRTLATVAGNALRMEAHIALARTGIALERYRLVHGEYPASLEGLVPEYLPKVLVDPFDRGPLRYRLQADGSPHVWSVGENLTDDGGLPNSDRNQGDLIWITKPIPGFTERDFRRR